MVVVSRLAARCPGVMTNLRCQAVRHKRAIAAQDRLAEPQTPATAGSSARATFGVSEDSC